MANIDFPSTPTVGQQYTFAGITYTFTTQGVWSPASSIAGLTGPQGRLTLQTNIPVMTTTVTGVTSLFYTPYVGNRIPIFNGLNMVMTVCPELTAVSTDTTKNPAAIGPTKINDWFVWNDAGTIRLSHGPDWTDLLNRSAGTALARVQGILVNSVAITNGPAAQRGTYVGSTYSDVSSHFIWQFGSAAAGGGEAILAVWNCYNRVLTTATVRDTTSSWAYGTGAYVPLNVSGPNGGLRNRMSFLSGAVEDVILTNLFCSASGAGVLAVVGVALDTTNGVDAQCIFETPPGSALVTALCSHTYPGQFGWHYVQAQQYWAGGGSVSYYGGVDEGLNGLFRM